MIALKGLVFIIVPFEIEVVLDFLNELWADGFTTIESSQSANKFRQLLSIIEPFVICMIFLYQIAHISHYEGEDQNTNENHEYAHNTLMVTLWSEVAEAYCSKTCKREIQCYQGILAWCHLIFAEFILLLEMWLAIGRMRCYLLAHDNPYDREDEAQEAHENKDALKFDVKAEPHYYLMVSVVFIEREVAILSNSLSISTGNEVFDVFALQILYSLHLVQIEVPSQELLDSERFEYENPVFGMRKIMKNFLRPRYQLKWKKRHKVPYKLAFDVFHGNCAEIMVVMKCIMAVWRLLIFEEVKDEIEQEEYFQHVIGKI